MRELKKISLAVVLALTLGTSAMAECGIISCPPEPPPPPTVVAQCGIISCPPSATQPADPVVTVALEVLQAVLSLPRF